eukprot:Nitzschia sp. Nitz4//scaffold174_size87051//48049//49275//NITZ4_005112-RA/size87051-processed-gene-0.90-mRNA-1//-1//CDS//3329538881//4712//frame0
MVYPRVREQPDNLQELEAQGALHRYDYPLLEPSPQTLHIEFSILASITALTSCFVFLLIVALLRSKRVMSNPFNLYLLCIAIPDFWISFLCFFTCVFSAPKSSFVSEWMCGFQSFYLNWGFVANCWLNAVIFFQIHKMLRHSKIRRRYIPPTHKQVLTHVGLVYAYATLWGFLCGFNFDFLPLSSHLYYGFSCGPMEYSLASTLFFWLVFLPFTTGNPLIFATYVTVDIIRNKLLPPQGKRRALSLFLLRLCFLYFAAWFPFIVLFFVGNFVVINPLMSWSAAAISHLQGLFSVLFCLINPDIRRSFFTLVTCQPLTAQDLREDADWKSASQKHSMTGSTQLPSLQSQKEQEDHADEEQDRMMEHYDNQEDGENPQQALPTATTTSRDMAKLEEANVAVEEDWSQGMN